MGDTTKSFPDSITRFLCNAPSVSPAATNHYVAAGIVHSDASQSVVSLSCETNTDTRATYSHETFGLDFTAMCCDDDSEESRPGCVYAVTYQEAFDVCDAAGLRLCTVLEVVSRKAMP